MRIKILFYLQVLFSFFAQLSRLNWRKWHNYKAFVSNFSKLGEPIRKACHSKLQYSELVISILLDNPTEEIVQYEEYVP